MYPVPVDGPDIFLAAIITTPPPACKRPPAPPLKNVGVVFDAVTEYPLIA